MMTQEGKNRIYIRAARKSMKKRDCSLGAPKEAKCAEKDRLAKPFGVCITPCLDLCYSRVSPQSIQYSRDVENA